uniref:Uncharacterized protein n=1 Tax=Arundo donax TaxID=35708 RepID=A0A0A9AMK5_ARUDO
MEVVEVRLRPKEHAFLTCLY